MKGILGISFLATILLAGTIAAGLPIQEADAAKKPKEIVVVGSKVKDVVRSVKIDFCEFTLFSPDGVPIRGKVSVSANPGGVIHLPDIDDEVLTVDVHCTFGDRSTESVNGVELKKRGTTVIQIGDLSRPGGGQ